MNKHLRLGRLTNYGALLFLFFLLELFNRRTLSSDLRVCLKLRRNHLIKGLLILDEHSIVLLGHGIQSRDKSNWWHVGWLHHRCPILRLLHTRHHWLHLDRRLHNFARHCDRITFSKLIPAIMFYDATHFVLHLKKLAFHRAGKLIGLRNILGIHRHIFVLLYGISVNVWQVELQVSCHYLF